jgi:hypothetical protein
MLLLFVFGLTSLHAARASAQPCPEISRPTVAWTGTALHDAIRKGDVHAARDLLTAESVNERDSFGNSPLVAALTPSASLEPVGVLGRQRSRAQIQGEAAARQAIVAALLKSDAAVNLAGADGVTPLIQLANWGYSPSIDRRLAQELIAAGANVNARDAFGSTALMFAARRGKSAMVELLLAKNADPRLANCHGETASSLAQAAGQHALARALKTAAAGRP